MVENLIGRRELADRLDVNPQTVTKWIGDGCPVAKPGRAGVPHLYREADVRAWLEEREAAKNNGSTIDLARERARKERAQAILAELRAAAMRRELLPADEVAREWDAVVAAVRAKLLNMPTALADGIHRAATLEGVVGVERELHAAVRDVLTELADPDLIDAPPPAKPKRKKRARKKARKKKAKPRRKSKAA